MGEKFVGEGPKTKLAESQFLKRINCHSNKMKFLKQCFAFFITKPLGMKFVVTWRLSVKI